MTPRNPPGGKGAQTLVPTICSASPPGRTIALLVHDRQCKTLERPVTVIWPVTFGYLAAVSGRQKASSGINKQSGTASHWWNFPSALCHCNRLLDILLNALNAM